MSDIGIAFAVLAVVIVVGVIGIGCGRYNLMHGGVRLVLFAAFLFLTVLP